VAQFFFQSLSLVLDLGQIRFLFQFICPPIPIFLSLTWCPNSVHTPSKFPQFCPNPAINISKFKLFFQTVHIGDTLFFELKIEALKEVKLIIDYIIYFQTKSGKLRPKVYKFKRLVLQKNESMTLQKKHLFKTHMSTRTLYEGEHTLEIQINAHIVQSTSFLLKKRV